MDSVRSLAPVSQGRGIRHARAVQLVLAGLLLAALLFGGGNERGRYGNSLISARRPQWSGVLLPAMATVEPSQEWTAEEQHASDDNITVELAKFHAPEAGEVLPMNPQYNYKDEAEAEAVASRAAATAGASTESPTAHLDKLSFEELKALLSEKKGWVNLRLYKDREALIGALYDLEQKESAQIAFRAEVAAAARWYAAQQSHRKATYRGLRSSRARSDSAKPADAGDSDGVQAQYELLVLYNEADGYRSKFEELRKELQESEATSLPNLADFSIIGQAYPISSGKALIGKALQGAFFATVGLALLSDQLNFLSESARAVLRQRRGLIISTGFLLNTLSGAALQNSAFEVFLDGERIYSGLDADGRLPTAELLSNLLLERTLLKDYYAAKMMAGL
ncbi:hypothetical protein LSCM1_00863 [Leishmania martiniquensis]|uniref:Uncharacterized protein n=1 Tax=Leishmania martiniquensis TaxID=1580590 RepID=A0A836GYP2_9TRYP|nr:hypothetical protein LSCM1_00863 [Leishmania martiniquensis]